MSACAELDRLAEPLLNPVACVPPLVRELYIETWGLGSGSWITSWKLCKKDAIPAVLSNALFWRDLHSSRYVQEAATALVSIGMAISMEGANGKHA